jgi:phosphoribosylaminoimidazolecarboxamide formyltransferase/IMP cyclohydrolase
MERQLKSALISVFYKDGLEPIVRKLHELEVVIYSTGGTQQFIEGLGIPCIPVEQVTNYPSILGGRVKTLHPKLFGGILARRQLAEDVAHVNEYEIPFIDLVIVDLYPFEETLKSTDEEKLIIEKIDIGGPSMIRAAAKNHQDVLVVAQRNDYEALGNLLGAQKSMTTLAQRRAFAAKAFEVVAHYDVAIAEYFRNEATDEFFLSVGQKQSLRYGENPHQPAVFYGAIDSLFDKLNGKELSYNNLVDVDAALQIMGEFQQPAFAIIKHTNVCGVALADTIENAWTAALSGDPESAFGGVLVTNRTITPAVASQINELFFEVLIAPTYEAEALATLKTKKNRILLQQKNNLAIEQEYKRILNGVLVQDADAKAYDKWEERGARETTEKEKQDLAFANIVCKHLKSNAIALIKDKKLIGKGCGQTSRIDALRQAIEKSKQFGFSLEGAVLASDAFFPFDDCARMAHEAGITAIIQPGGSVRDQDTINYCKDHGLALVMTGMRHFKH